LIDIEYNTTTKRFLVKVHNALLDVVRTIPNRRWDSKRCLWIVPALHTNIHVLRGILSKFSDVAKVSEDARAAIVGAKEPERILSPFPLNYTFKTNPFKHQQAALDKIWGNKASALFMEPGTGKSKVAIDWFCSLSKDDSIDAVVVFCPVSIRINWLDQIKTHATVDCAARVQGAKAEPDKLVQTPVLICGIESLSVGAAKGNAYKDVAAFISGRRVAMIVDESHLIKTHDSIRTKNIIKLGAQAKYKLCLTGTPVTQGVMDLYSQFEFLDTDILGIGDFYSFRNRYAIMGGYENKQIMGYQNVEELTEMLKPFIYQCRKHEVLDLPPKVYQKRYVELTGEQERVYKQMKRDRLAFLSKDGVALDIAVENILTVYQHLQTITSGFMYTEDDNGNKFTSRIGVNPKIGEMCKVIEDLPEDTKVIVWCRYREEMEQAHLALVKYGGVSLRTGSMSEEDKDKHLREFKTGPNRFFVSSQAAGGVGLTLNEATVAIYLSNTFSTTDRIQSEDRFHRIGQTSSVLYVDILAKGTIDEHIVKALENKMELAEYIKHQIANKKEIV
jgi:superfamily II DNA or RNA helicase